MKTPIKSVQLLLIILLATAAFCASRAACAQDPGTASPASQAPGSVAVTGQPKGLYINIIEGEGALNDIRSRTAREPIVEVDDENHKPVAGALVLFAVDNGGSGSPFATFSGANTVSATTDAAGRAAGRGFQITQVKGQYKINVHVTKGDLQADSVILQTNIEAALSPSGGTTTAAVAAHHVHWGWIVGGIAVAGGAVGVVIATHGSSSPTTVTPGTGTVGAPAAVGGIRIPLHGHAH